MSEAERSAAEGIEKAYVIGAGFSRGLEFPLMSDVFTEVESFCAGGVGVRCWSLPEKLTRFRANYAPGLSSTDAVTLCDLLQSAADIEGWVPAVAEFVPSRILKELRLTLYQMFHWKLNETVQQGKDVKGRFFAEHGAFLFVSFNWDNVLERGLYQSNTKIWFADKRDPDDHVLVLKPHGSVDWIWKRESEEWFTDRYWPLGSPLVKGSRRSGDNEIVHPSADVCRLKSVEDPQRAWETVRDEPRLPQMITMGHGKGKTMREAAYKRIKERWEQASTFLGRAHKIVIIGYSMPPDDVEARLLLRSAIWQHKKQFGEEPVVKVIDPCACAIQRIREALAPTKWEPVQEPFNPNNPDQWK